MEPAAANANEVPGTLIGHCLNCGSDRLDGAEQIRAGEIVQCLCCGEWNGCLPD
ncbi:MAG TPA: hypothetical protein VF132_07385 [Rudaea sp.]